MDYNIPTEPAASSSSPSSDQLEIEPSPPSLQNPQEVGNGIRNSHNFQEIEPSPSSLRFREVAGIYLDNFQEIEPSPPSLRNRKKFGIRNFGNFLPSLRNRKKVGIRNFGNFQEIEPSPPSPEKVLEDEEDGLNEVESLEADKSEADVNNTHDQLGETNEVSPGVDVISRVTVSIISYTYTYR
ncbi:hypothetical protein Pyn_20877 [Prunus yedoensis var. nudiflora]|uniref:Uncharacterized protein n=1 Tax=Prunus yedoensis var. nudiflora TaxID=2094558 RepID=A0A314XSN3_PRUYE|nr:hypothetical protein Pyn_20877 [Prunus yedoensis var. nudiflora]